MDIKIYFEGPPDKTDVETALEAVSSQLSAISEVDSVNLVSGLYQSERFMGGVGSNLNARYQKSVGHERRTILLEIIEEVDLIVIDLSGWTRDAAVTLGMAAAAAPQKVVIVTDLDISDGPKRDGPSGGYPTVRYYSSESADTGVKLAGELRRQILTHLNIQSDLDIETLTANESQRLFVSYSHKDRKFLERLMVHLKPLERQGVVQVWSDEKITAGSEWRQSIDTALSRSQIAVLLVSPDFLASDFIVENELPPLLEEAERRGTLIIPLIVRPCLFHRHPELTRYQAANDPSKPLSAADGALQDRILTDLADSIYDYVDQN